jgi:hypothetical protein
MLALALVAIAPQPTSAAGVTFTQRFTTNDTGDIVYVANTVTTCPTTAPECAPAQQGVGAKADFLNNNFYSMVYVNVDGATPGIFDSSRASLALPGGLPASQSVLFAGLYWGGRTTKAARNQVLLRTPAAGYQTVTGALTGPTVPGASGVPEAYQMFADVTGLVRAGGAGTYSVANVQTDLGTDRYGGWALVVAFRDPTAPPRNLTIFDGFGAVQTAGGNTTVDIGISGVTAPPSGVVNAHVGVVAWEGDAGLTGDSLQLDGGFGTFTTLSDPLNPSDNFFNSTILASGSARVVEGARLRQPDGARRRHHPDDQSDQERG